MKNKGSISRRIVTLVVVSIILVGLCTSMGGAVLLGSKVYRSTINYLGLATYTIEKETALMNAENTKMGTVTEMLAEFKELHSTDVTIFAYDAEKDTLIRKISTLGCGT